MTRTTNGIATSACAIGTSHDDARRSSGGSSSAMRNPKPTVTADTPSGSDSSVSRPRPRRARRASANAPQPADDDRDHASRWPRTAASCAIASIGGTNSVLPACDLAERAVEVEAVARRWVERPLDQHERAARRAAATISARLRGERARARRRVRGRRAVSRGGPQPERDVACGPRSSPVTTSSATTATSCTIVSAAASGRSSSCAVWR